MTKEKKETGWLQYLIAPAIVGVIMLIGQSFLQPTIAKKSLQETERWQQKKQAFLDAVALINIQFAAHPFDVGPDAVKEPVEHVEPPSPNELNRVYSQLLLFSDDREIIDAFLGCLGARENQQTVWHDEKIKMIQLMRKELGYDDIALNKKDVRFWVRKIPPDSLNSK